MEERDEWRAERERWHSDADKLTVGWGDAQAKTLWQSTYAPWDPVIDGRTVLDLGCHWGYMLKFLLEHHRPRKLIGVDVAPLWEEITGWDWHAHSDVVELHHGALPALGLEAESIDVLLCSGVLQSIAPDALPETLGEAYRLLRPGGEMLLRTHLYTSHLGGSVHRLIDEPFVHLRFGEAVVNARLREADIGPPDQFNWLTASSYLALFSQVGFEVADARRIPNRHARTTQESLVDEFGVDSNELCCESLAARLIKPIGVEDLHRFATVQDQRGA